MHDFIVQNTEPAGCDRTHRQFLVPGNAELAHEKDIERRAKCIGDFKTDGYPAAGQRQDKNIRLIRVARQLLR